MRKKFHREMSVDRRWSSSHSCSRPACSLFGVIQFGVVFNNYITLTDAVRVGARKGAVGRHLQDPQAAVDADGPDRRHDTSSLPIS